MSVSICAFIIFLFVPKLLGPEQFGVYSFLTAFVSLLLPLSSIGIGSGIIYLLGSHKFQFSQVNGSIYKMAFILAICNALLVFLIYWTGWINFFEITFYPGQLILFLITCFCQTISFIIGRVFFGNSEFKLLNKLDLFTVFLNPLALLGCFTLFGNENLNFIYIAYCFSAGIVCILHLYSIYLPGTQCKSDSNFTRQTIQYGLKSWPGDLAVRANLRLDQLLLISYVSAGALGIYNLAVKCAEMIWMLPDAIGPVLFNVIAKNQDPSHSVELIARLHRILFYLSFVLLAGLAGVLLIIVIPYFLGQNYQEMLWPFLLLIPGTLFLISSKIVSKLFSASGDVHRTSQISILGALISLVAYLICIPLYGMAGAALASSLGYSCMALAGLYLVKVQFKIRLMDFYAFRKADWIWLKFKFNSLVISSAASGSQIHPDEGD